LGLLAFFGQKEPALKACFGVIVRRQQCMRRNFSRPKFRFGFGGAATVHAHPGTCGMNVGTRKKTIVPAIPDGENHMILQLLVLTEYLGYSRDPTSICLPLRYNKPRN